MIRRKHLLTLLLVIIPILVTTQTTNGQTITNTARIATSLATSTQLRSEPIFPIPPQLGAITIPPTHGVCGVYFVQAFNATAGAIISGTMTADNPVDFYIMTEFGFRTWSNQILVGGICTPSSLVLSKQSTTSYNFSIAAPHDGYYELVLDNLSTATVHVNLSVSKGSPTLVSVTRYSTMTTLTQPSVQTMTQTSTVQAATSGQNTSTWLAAALIIIAILAVILYQVTKRKQRESTSSKKK